MTTPTSSGIFRGTGTWSGPGSRGENRLRFYIFQFAKTMNSLRNEIATGTRNVSDCFSIQKLFTQKRNVNFSTQNSLTKNKS